MRIISDFRDFYDSVQRMGQDFDLKYIRKSKWVAFGKSAPMPLRGRHTYASHCYGHEGSTHHYGPRLDQLTIKRFLIGFCGKVYLAIKIDPGYDRVYRSDGTYLCGVRQPDGSVKVIERGSVKVIERGQYCYNIEQVDQFFAESVPSRVVDVYKTGKDYRNRRDAWRYSGPYTRKDFEAEFAECERVTNNYADIFLKHQTPIFLYEGKTLSRDEDAKAVKARSRHENEQNAIILNARLKDFDFARVFDPYRAFQELQMFLGGMAKPEKPIPQLSDIDMLQAKGFDKKYSFRKDKEPKKKK